MFEISNYDDDIIKQKLDEKLAENQKNKKYSNKSKGNHKKNSYNTNTNKNSYSTKKRYYSKNYNNKHYKKNKKYQTEIVEITDINTEGKKEEPTVIEKEIELNDIKKELSEIDEEDKVTSTATTSNKGMDMLSNDDNEKNSDYYDNMNNGMYASKLFPGVFFSKPIELDLHKEKSEDFALNKRKKYNEGLSRAYEYYSSFFNNKTNTE